MTRKEERDTWKEEFNLSDKIFHIDLGNSRGTKRFQRKTLIPKNNKNRFYFDDVKEFIERLKDIDDAVPCTSKSCRLCKLWLKKIDKLAGDKLI